MHGFNHSIATNADNVYICDGQVLVDSWGSAANVWRVPEMGNDYIGSIKVEEEVEDKDGWKMRHREASVLRYKEKQNRLFSKRIRYEVRKLNAEKRPRMKVTLSLPYALFLFLLVGLCLFVRANNF